MKKERWQIWFGISLILLSAMLYAVHYLLFRDAHHIFFYLVSDIAFIPIEVLLVTLVIHRLLEVREKRVILQKMNMAIGVFFGEIGSDLLKKFQEVTVERDTLGRDFMIDGGWMDSEFGSLVKKYHGHVPEIDCGRTDLEGIREFLLARRAFLVGLLENPNLLEHEGFTDLLWALFHLTEELSHRTDLPEKGTADCEHLAGDIRRAYGLLLSEWLGYMRHLKKDYPYLFSLAMRMNPFSKSVKIEIV